jgi:hypothetical protein
MIVSMCFRMTHSLQQRLVANIMIDIYLYIFFTLGVEGVVCGPEGTHLAGGCILSKLG